MLNERSLKYHVWKKNWIYIYINFKKKLQSIYEPLLLQITSKSQNWGIFCISVISWLFFFSHFPSFTRKKSLPSYTLTTKCKLQFPLFLCITLELAPWIWPTQKSFLISSESLGLVNSFNRRLKEKSSAIMYETQVKTFNKLKERT